MNRDLIHQGNDHIRQDIGDRHVPAAKSCPLLYRRVITWHIPVTYLGTVFVVSLLAGQNLGLQMFGGGLMLGAFFMATDYTTSPMTDKGKLIYGVGCGLLTMMIRLWGSVPEGVSYAILLMNILTPHIDRVVRMKPLGGA